MAANAGSFPAITRQANSIDVSISSENGSFSSVSRAILDEKVTKTSDACSISFGDDSMPDENGSTTNISSTVPEEKVAEKEDVESFPHEKHQGPHDDAEIDEKEKEHEKKSGSQKRSLNRPTKTMRRST